MSAHSTRRDRSSDDDFFVMDEGGSQSSALAATARDSVRRFFVVLLERKWFFALIVLLIFGAVAALSLMSTPLYRAAATLELLRQEEQRSGFERVIDFDVRTPEDFNTRVQVLESDSIVNGVASRLEESGRLERLLAAYRSDDPSEQIDARRLIARHREVSPVRGSRYVSVEYVHPNPNVAAEIANLFVEEYLAYNAELRRESARNAVADLRVQAEAQLERVKEVEYQLADFRERYASISFDHDSNINERELIELNSMLTEARQILDRAEARWAMVDGARARNEPLYEIGFLVEGEQVEQLLLDLSRLEVERSRLAERYRPAHPAMIEIEQALTETRAQLDRALASAAEAVTNEYNLAADGFARIQQRIRDVMDENFVLGKLRPEYSSLQRKLQVNDEMYRHFYNRMQEAEAQLSEDTQSGRVVDLAVPPIEPFAPRHTLNFLLGGILGLTGGCGFVLLCLILDNRLKSVTDIEFTLGLPVLGVIPSLKEIDPLDRPRVTTLKEGSSLAVEAFRTVLSSLRLSPTGRNAQSIVITSTLPGEGKSLVSSNLAFTQAGLGDRTLLIDVDLRLPRVASNLQIDDEGTGLIPVLQGEMTFEEAVVRDYVPNADVLPTGGRYPNPQYLFNQKVFRELIGSLREQYDFIFFDATPLAPISDVLSLLGHVDGVIYTVHFGKVPRHLVRANLRRLADADKPVLGSILNNVSFQAGQYYHPEYYDRRYRGYYQEEPRNGHAAGAEKKLAVNR